MIQIIAAEIEDVKIIRKIARETWWPTYETILSAEQIAYMLDKIYAEEKIKEQIESAEQSYLLLLEDQIPAAFASYSQDTEQLDAYKLHKLYCLPQFQGKGFGLKLIDEVSHIAKDRGKSTLLLNVNRNNNALSFYQKVGFSIAQEVDIPIGPYWMNDYVMQKAL